MSRRYGHLSIQTFTNIENVISLVDANYTRTEHIIAKIAKDKHQINLSTIIHQDLFLEILKYSKDSMKLINLFRNSASLCRRALNLHPEICRMAGYKPEDVLKRLENELNIDLDNKGMVKLSISHPVVRGIISSMEIEFKKHHISNYILGRNKPIKRFIYSRRSLSRALFEMGLTVIPKNKNKPIAKNVYVTNKSKIKLYWNMVREFAESSSDYSLIYILLRNFILSISEPVLPESRLTTNSSIPEWLVMGLLGYIIEEHHLDALKKRLATLTVYRLIHNSFGVPDINTLQYYIDKGVITQFPPPFDYSGKPLIHNAFRLGDRRTLIAILDIMQPKELSTYILTQDNIATLKSIASFETI